MNEEIRVSGLMSGSSLDGVDLACCAFIMKEGQWNYRILKAETRAYPDDLKTRLKGHQHWDKTNMSECDRDLGEFYGQLLKEFHVRHGLRPHLISSHGHTLVHDASKGITYQAGSGKRIARICSLPVINDFRREDVANGGQGAPLVPVGDRLLFGEFGACVNLGGFGNISFENDKGERIAFDTGPVNLALNHIASGLGLDFDQNGNLASSGSVNVALLSQLEALEFFHRPPPKSLGKEWFYAHYLPLLEFSTLPLRDLAATTSEQIARAVTRAIGLSRAKEVLLSGGGACNTTLVKHIKNLSKAKIHIPASELIHHKEALVFAFLGLLRSRGEINCLASVSGGRTDLSTGRIHLP